MLSAGGDAGESVTRKAISHVYCKLDHGLHGVTSDVSALDGTRRRPWYARAIARWTASTSVSW